MIVQFMMFYIISIIFSNIVLFSYYVFNYKNSINLKNILDFDYICIILLYFLIILSIGINLIFFLILIKKMLKNSI